MKKCAFLIVISIFLVLSLFAILSGCNYQKPSIELKIEGQAYRGAVCDVYATLKNIENYDDVDFEILEDYDWVLLKDRKLMFTKDAVVGATVSVKVTTGNLSDVKVIQVGNTPVKSLAIEEIPYLTASEVYELSVVIEPAYADDVIITYEVVKGQEFAEIIGNRLCISADANYTDDIRVVAKGGNKISDEIPVKISTVQPESLQLKSSSYQLKRGEQAKITCIVSPSNCTLGTAELIVPQSEYYTYNPLGILTISDNAPVGEITIKARLGKLTETITVKIIKTDVENVELVASKYGNLQYQDVVDLSVSVIPSTATETTVSLTVSEGEDCIEFISEFSFRVITCEVSERIVITATVDGKSSYLVFETVAIPVEDFTISIDGNSSVTVGTVRSFNIRIIPQNATEQTVVYEIVEGSEYARLNGNSIEFTSIGSAKTKVIVSIKAGSIEKSVSFVIAPIPTEKVEIYTLDKTVDLVSGDSVVFGATVYPSNASYCSLTYYFESGEQFGFIVDNVFTVKENSGKGKVEIYAETDDGIKSNVISIEIFGNVKSFTPTDWSSIDNDATLFDNTDSVRINFSLLPADADYTTIIISDDVEYIEFIGNCDGENSVIYNLNLYFLTTDSIYVKFENVAIKCNGGFCEYVVDYGPTAVVVMEIVGENYLEASDAYKPKADDYLQNGEITGVESKDYLLKHGMNGFGGVDGGTTIHASDLQISGNGNLKLVAGSGSNGTDGADGANSEGTVFAGNGGTGGYGGNSGYAIFCNKFICNVKGNLILIGGNAGQGGTGGRNGVNANTLYNGNVGSDGTDGIAYNPIFVSDQMIELTTNYIVKTGKVSDNDVIRSFVYDQFADTLSKFYKIKVHYGNDLYNPHASYPMTKQTSVYEINRLMYALDYALQFVPKNLYIEINSLSANAINVYLVNTISSGRVYGLTSSVNNLWFATFDTRLRGVYYSTPYNIMMHELFHLLTYNLDSTVDASLKKVLPTYNLGYSYTTTTAGVYDPDNPTESKRCSASYSVFLCSYSKTNYSEDISDNVSMIAMLVSKPDYLEQDKAFYKKLMYIDSVYVGAYRNLTANTPSRWLKFV